MKIVDVIADVVKCPLPAPFYPTWGRGMEQRSVGMTLVQIVSDSGHIGLGAGPATGWENVVGVHTFLKHQLIDKDPMMIEHIRPCISNAKLRMGWPWMAEAALWDLAGKVCNQPVYKMWGGFANAIPIYASAGELKPFEERCAYVQSCIDAGFKGVKLRMHDPVPEKDLEQIEAIIGEFKGQIAFMVDANQADHLPGASDITSSWDAYTALRVARKLEALGALWLEEPLSRHDYDGLKMLARKCDIPIAGGEKNSGLNEFRILIENEGYQILQGDCVFSEGMFELRKAAAMAEAHRKQFIPHTWSNPIGLLTNLQLAASLPNCPWFEVPFEPPAYTLDMYDDIFTSGISVVGGKIQVPEKPGLGFTLVDEYLDKNRVVCDPAVFAPL